MSVSLESRVAQLESELAVIKARLTSTETRRTEKAEIRIADDDDLDSQYGDPVIRYGLKPKWWKQQPDIHVGRSFSQCEPEYLAALGKYYRACAYMARKDGDEKKAGYKDRDAARAEGWRVRNETRKAAASVPSVPQDFAEDDGSAEAYASQFDGEEIPF